MITRLEVDGFKSLRNFAVDLEPFTVLVGPNDAGKSNILEALALVARLGYMTPEDALKHGRGLAIDQFWRHGTTVSQNISFGLECLEPDAEDHGEAGNSTWADRLRYELSLTRTPVVPRGERVSISDSVRTIRVADDRWRTEHTEWHAHIADTTEDREWKFLPGFRLIQLNASHLREPSQRIDSGELAPDASNLPSILATLPETQLGMIRATLVAMIPGLSDFDVVERDESFQIEFHTREGEKVPARLASDGTLRVLALLTAVLARPSSSWDTLVCIEEPENGIYPGRLARLLEVLRELTDSSDWRAGNTESPPPQIILTTHSPVALAALRQHRQVIRLVDVIRRDGVRCTRARPIVENVRDRLTEASAIEIEHLLRTVQPDEPR